MPLIRFLLIAALSVSISAALSAQDKQRNIIVILTDDHRYDALGFLDHPFLETPNLDRLAKDGVHFENAFVTTSLCSPSRASILTGLYAHNHGVVDNYNPVREDLTFFPQLLQEAGYETAFIGKWHMGGEVDDPQRGFDHWVSFKGQGIYWPHEEGLKVKGRYVPQATKSGINVNGERVDQKGYITDELTDYAMDWLNTRSRDKPYCLYLSHKAVHADFLPPNRFAYRYEGEEVPAPLTWADAPEEFRDVPMWVKNQRNSRHGVEFAYYTNLNLTDYYKRYCETILAVDESLGRLLGWLDRTGDTEETLILYLGDNGFLFGEHGLIDKRCAYEESIRIPMIWHCPAVSPKGITVSETVANIDVAPTILDFAGLQVPENMDGTSFLPLAKGEDDVEWANELLYEYYWERNYPQTPTTHSLRAGRYKYIRYHGVWDTDELYDLEEDPQERINLINDPEYAETIESMNVRMFEMLQQSHGEEMPLLPDKGTKFYHRKDGGSKGAPFPDWFYREAGTSGK